MFYVWKIVHPKLKKHGVICWQEHFLVTNSVRNLNSIYQSLKNTRIKYFLFFNTILLYLLKIQHEIFLNVVCSGMKLISNITKSDEYIVTY